jgi:type II secretory ATPase GspE/PulE/Tfp pilus assembly ATPase PilB-like protein
MHNSFSWILSRLGISVSNEAPAISIVNMLLTKALAAKASDIHLEPLKAGLRVRLRIDGLLSDEPAIDQEHGLLVISRIKVLAHMNVSERRIPQDGKFTYCFNNGEVDLRTATFPSIYGEKIVIRILYRTESTLTIDYLGFDSDMLETIKSLVHRANGFFLVTGPTGSGKTTTLHAMVSLVCLPEKNIISLEDPIEYYVEGITQGQVYPEIGFTFQKGIRALLRQDPDIIMIGEIRDYETAQVAIQAALTGHFVLSTLHTQDTVGALIRLLDIGIEPFLLNGALTALIAQRLVRKLCLNCRYKALPDDQERALLNYLKLPIEFLYKSSGCVTCRATGYTGRIGIFELLVISPELRALILQCPGLDPLYVQAYADGMRPLVDSAASKVREGVTSLYELARVLL